MLCAAVADFRPAHIETQKIKKENRASLVLELVPTRDILRSLHDYTPAEGQRKPLVVGFAAETNALAENARRKLREKGCALIIANDVSRNDSRFRQRRKRTATFSLRPVRNAHCARAKKETLAMQEL